MSLPANWAAVPVTGTFVDSNGAPLSGSVIFSTPTAVVVDGVIVIPREKAARLDATGNISISLPSTNDPDLSLVGWAYTVVEDFDGGRKPYTLVVPYNSTGIDLSNVDTGTPDPVSTDPYLRESDIGATVASQASVEAAQDAAAGAQQAAEDAQADVDSHEALTNNPHGVTKTQVGLGNVDNTSDASKPVSGPQQIALDARAPLASPAFTGVPTAPTAALGTNTNQLATMAALAAAIANLLDSAPGALDTLNELAAALGDDPNFSATVTNALAQKQPLAAYLTNLVALARSANKIAYSTGTDTVALADFTALARTLLAGADQAAMLATLGAIAVSTKGAAGGVAPLNSDARLDPIYRAKKRVTVAPAAGVLTIDLATLDDAYIALSANVTSTAFTNGPPAGYAREGLLIFVQDATGSRTWAPPAGAKWPNGLAAVLTSAANAVDHIGYRVYNNAGVLEYTFYPVRDVR